MYISPETLTENQPYRNMLLTEAYKSNLVALAIDEAHTVTSWYVVWMQLLLLASYNCLLSYLFIGQTFDSDSVKLVKFDL